MDTAIPLDESATKGFHAEAKRGFSSVVANGVKKALLATNVSTSPGDSTPAPAAETATENQTSFRDGAVNGFAKKIVGSTAYMCPEIVKWARESDPSKAMLTAEAFGLVSKAQLGLWSFAGTLFEMVSGHSLFSHSYDILSDEGDSSMQNWTGLSTARVKQLTTNHRKLTPDDCQALEDLLQWCLDPDPSARPTAMSEVLEHGFFDPSAGSLREHFMVAKIRSLLPKLGDAPREYVRVMISYCWADSQFVLGKLAPALAPLVDHLWLDRLGGADGMSEWCNASMEAGVQGADVIISLVSPSYVKSKNCGFELELAAKHGKVRVGARRRAFC